MSKDTTMENFKFDSHKIRLDLVSTQYLLDLGRVLTHGAEKYKAESWKNLDDKENRYYAALFRHLLAWRDGEKVDPDSGLSHMAHIAANAMFLHYFDKEAQNEDRNTVEDTKAVCDLCKRSKPDNGPSSDTGCP